MFQARSEPARATLQSSVVLVGKDKWQMAVEAADSAITNAWRWTREEALFQNPTSGFLYRPPIETQMDLFPNVHYFYSQVIITAKVKGDGRPKDYNVSPG